MRRHATALTLIPFVAALRYFRSAVRERLRKSAPVDARGKTRRAARPRFTGEEDVITPVNYFVVGDTREKHKSARSPGALP